MRGGFDYYAAPNCNVLCSSGSGEPKANGTQECSCASLKTASMVAGGNFLIYGYSPSFGSLTPDTYKGIKITKFTTLTLGSNSTIVFEKIKGIPETIKIKINGTTYDFVKTTSTDEDTGEVSIYWKCKAKIFEKDKTYTIEFLN